MNGWRCTFPCILSIASGGIGDIEIMRVPGCRVSAQAVAAISAIGLGLFMLVRTSGPSIEVRSRVCELGTALPKTRYPVAFLFHNSGSEPVHFLGGNSYCSANGCISSFTSQPGAVGPGEDFEVKATFRTPAAGRFRYNFVVYADAPGQSSIRLTIQGESVAAQPVSAEYTARAVAD